MGRKNPIFEALPNIGNLTYRPINYRPFSLLPLISKVQERVIHDQTNTFLKEKNLLYNYQSGFKTIIQLTYASHF